MSQIRFPANWQDHPVEVLLGWASRESQVFVKVALLDDKGEWRDDVQLVLDAWKDVAVRPTEAADAASLAEGIRDQLSKLGIQVPDILLGEVAAHIVLDARNVIVHYDEAFARTLVSSDVEGYR